jgi:putative DNA primase/helicase
MSGVVQFRDFAASLGYELPQDIQPGCRFRFSTNGKRGDDAGWGILFHDGLGGVVGDWRSGQKQVWQAKRDRRLTSDEYHELQAKIEREKRADQAEREREAAEAAGRAAQIWEASKPAASEHPYLKRKGVKSHGLRQHDDALVIPIRDGTKLHSLQFIGSDGGKRFLSGVRVSGCYFPIGKPAGVICICEGYATAASVHERSGHAVAVAFDAGNLQPVARRLRAKHPEVKLIICADNDVGAVCALHRREGLTLAVPPFDHRPEWCRCNPGVTYGIEAARAIGGLLAVPELDDGTDFNDLAAKGGDVKAQIEAAKPAPMNSASEPCYAGDDVSGLVLRRVSDVTPKPVRWLWPSRIAKGKVSMLAGHPGLGKSQMCVSLAAIVTTGGQWPVDRTRCEQGTVLIFSAEDDAEDTIRPRLEAAGADLSRVHVLESVAIRERDGSLTRRAFSLVQDMPRLAAKLAELGDVALVVIDPVTAYMGDTDSHKNAEVRAVLSQVAEVAGKYGTAVIAVSHLRKSVAGEAMQQITGSLAFVAAARAVYIVAKDQADPVRRLLLPVKNNLGDDLTGYAFRIEPTTLPGGIPTSRLAWEGERVTVTADEILATAEDREERSAVEEAGDFLRGLLADGPVPVRQIKRDAEDAGHHWASIRRAQKQLVIEAEKDGLRGGWSWKLLPKVLKTSEDAQAQTLSAFGKNEHLRETEGREEPASADDRERF